MTLSKKSIPFLIPYPNTHQAKQAGIQNILALRGDPPKGETTFTTVEGQTDERFWLFTRFWLRRVSLRFGFDPIH